MMTETNAGFTTQESAITVDLNAETPDAVIEVITTQGPKGDKGTGVKNAFLNDEDCLVIQLDDGRGFVSESLRGQQGPMGPMGLPGLKPEKYVDYWTPEDQKEIITEVKKDSASPIVHSASGSSLVLYNTADRPLRELKINGKTMQVGMPSLDTPAELVSVGNDGSIEVKVCEKNLFDKYEYATSMLFVDTANNAFIDAGDIRSVIIPITPNTTYTVSKSTATIMRVGTSVEYPDAGMTMTKFANHSVASNAPLTVTSGDSDHWMLVQLFVNADVGTDYGSIDAHVESLMIEVGSVATEYEPNAGSNIIIPVSNGLSGIPVSSDGNYTDESGQQWICDEIDLARGVYVQRIGKMVYDGSDDETWIVTGTRYRIAVPDMLEHTDATVAPPVMCDKYITVTPNANYAGTISISAQQWGGAVVLLVKNDDLADVSAFKASLAEKPMEVLVVLANPIETPLPAAVIAASKALRTYKPITNILNDSGAGMQVQYISDTQIYVDTHTVPSPEAAKVGQLIMVDKVSSGDKLIATRAIEAYELNMAPAIECTTVGSTIGVRDSADAPFRNLKLFGKTTQDGTPSPDAPVELVNVGDDGSIDVAVCGKNILSYPYAEKTKTQNGITFTVMDDGTVITNGTATAATYFRFSTADSPITGLEVGKSYIFSACPKGGSYNTYCARMSVDGTNKVETGSSIEFVAGAINYAYIYIATGVTVNNIEFKPMIRLAADTDGAYESFKSSGHLTLSTPNGLPGIPVASGGNYTDENGQQWLCCYADFNKGKLMSCVRRYVFDGVNNKMHWMSASSTTLNTQIKFGENNSALAIGEVLCNYLPYAEGMWTPAPFPHIWCNNDAGNIYIRGYMPSSIVGSTKEEVNAWAIASYAEGNPLEVIAKLKEPEEVRDLTDAELNAYKALHTNKLNTVIINDSGAGMQVDYAADTKAYIDNKFAELAAAMVANT